MLNLKKRINLFFFRQKWLVLLVLLALPSFLLFIFINTHNSHSHSSKLKSESWLNKKPRLTSPIPVVQREKIYEAALKPLLSIPSTSLSKLGTFHPNCPSVIDIKLRYTDFSTFTKSTTTTFGATKPGESTAGMTIYLAIRIEKPEDLISAFTYELTALILYIGSHRFFVHVVFADGVRAHSGLAKSFERTLDELRVAYKITFESKPTSQSYVTENVNRKNLLMEPFYTGDAMRQLNIVKFEYVMFMEDVVFCAEDVLELLYEHKFQGAHLTCALEWRGGLLYDKWTIRTLTGKPPYMQSDLSNYFTQKSESEIQYAQIPKPFLTDQAARKRYSLLRSFPVFSCWSSIVVVDANAFMPTSSVSIPDNVDVDADSGVIQNQDQGLRFRIPSSEEPDKYSETFLFCVDMWVKGLFKTIIVPRASIGDTFLMYDFTRQDGRRNAAKYPHPAGLEPEGRALVSYFRWTREPPDEVVYHDFSLWHKNERVGKWDELLSLNANHEQSL